MTRPADEPAATRYRAFISYSHADDRFSRWLHRRLESYRLPADSNGRAERFAPVFLDRAELAAGPDLSAQVKDALAASDALVVVCSPAAAASRWVAQEIALFRERHPDSPVLAALIAGEPDEAFPAPLLRHGGADFEPLAADFRKEGDGRRLALIKIMAGLTGLPLDRLVQRDAQARQRRVMAVTAAASLLSVVLAFLLMTALRERAEAQRQRADAEGMVEFMLTDLRDRLKGVGRLEIMESVNRKAMEHYASDRNLADLPADMLQRRARLLIAMGEDDRAAGKTAQAAQEFAEAYRVTADLLARQPDNPERLFNHAQSEYWMGSVPFDQGDKARTRPHWSAYLDLAGKLVAMEPGKLEWQRELGYAQANMCALAQFKPVEPDKALDHCGKASRVAGDIARAHPNDLAAQIDYASNIAWHADASRLAGKGDAAVTLRQDQVSLTRTLADRYPRDMRALEALLKAEIGLAMTYSELGQLEPARSAARQALEVSDRLVAQDPDNERWLTLRKRANGLIADPASKGKIKEGTR